jgi:hypothetical protein
MLLLSGHDVDAVGSRELERIAHGKRAAAW